MAAAEASAKPRSFISARPLEEATRVQSMLTQEELRKEPRQGSPRSSMVELLSFSGEHAEAMFFLTRHLITSMEKVDKAGSWAKASTLPWIDHCKAHLLRRSPSCAEQSMFLAVPQTARASCAPHRPADIAVE